MKKGNCLNGGLFIAYHARKVDYIKQEVFARLLLYNYCELITTHVVQQMQNNDKTKQVNFTIAIYICREYLRQKRNLSPPDVIKLIEKYTLPVRPGRKNSEIQVTGIGKFSIQSGSITTYYMLFYAVF